VESVELKIGTKIFANWTSLEIRVGLDEIDTIALSAPFEAERKEFRALFRPLSFQDIEVTVGNVALFTGILVDVLPNVTPDSRMVECSGYSRPGVLQDCTPPADSLPLEWKNATFRTIATDLCARFGIDVDFNLTDDSPFSLVGLDPNGSLKEYKSKSAIKEESGDAWSFLAKLAKQRNALLTSSTLGRLKIWRADPDTTPVVQLKGGLPPLLQVRPTFQPQEYFSEITCFSPKTRKKKGSQYTVQNPRLPSVIRPHCFKADDSEDADAPAAAAAKAGRMFGNAASFTIEGIPTWRDPSGALWRPNSLLRLEAPDCMIYEPTDLLIRSVTFRQAAEAETADLEVVFPGSFSGEAPDRFPWDA